MKNEPDMFKFLFGTHDALWVTSFARHLSNATGKKYRLLTISKAALARMGAGDRQEV